MLAEITQQPQLTLQRKNCTYYFVFLRMHDYWTLCEKLKQFDLRINIWIINQIIPFKYIEWKKLQELNLMCCWVCFSRAFKIWKLNYTCSWRISRFRNNKIYKSRCLSEGNIDIHQIIEHWHWTMTAFEHYKNHFVSFLYLDVWWFWFHDGQAKTDTRFKESEWTKITK